MEDQEKLLTQGFNHGYLLSKYEPDLAAKLTANNNENSDYFKGLVSGKEEHEREIGEWAKSFSRGNNEIDRRDLGREK